MIELVGKLYAWLLIRAFRRAGYVGADGLIRREIDAVKSSVTAHFDYQQSEVSILVERLSRRYDPGMALNEAINRAQVQQRAAIDFPVSDKQKMAIAFRAQQAVRQMARSA